MHIKQLVRALVMCAVLCVVFVMVKRWNTLHISGDEFMIGILQTASHPALNAVKKGFMHEIEQEFGATVRFIIKNGEGSVANTHALASSLVLNEEVSTIFAIATPAAQAISALHYQNPLIVAAITNPKIFMKKEQIALCGVTDMSDIPLQIDAILSLVPRIETMALLYTTGETNSLLQVTLMEQELVKRGVAVIKNGINSEVDIPFAASQAFRSADAVLSPTDNVIASAVRVVADIARTMDKPFFTSDNLLVKYGALMGSGVDFYACGKQAGKQAIAVLKDKKPASEIGIVPCSENMLVINEERLTHFGLTIPEKFKNMITITHSAQ